MAAADYFLKIDGVKGESHDDKHKGEIDLESWSWGESNSGAHASGGGGGAGKVSMQDFHFTMKINKASPELMIGCATGKVFTKAVLTCRKAGGKQEEFFKVTMSDLLVSSFQTGGSAHGDVIPIDQISLNFSKIEYEYSPQKADGTLDSPIKVGYDLKANKKV